MQSMSGRSLSASSTLAQAPTMAPAPEWHANFDQSSRDGDGDDDDVTDGGGDGRSCLVSRMEEYQLRMRTLRNKAARRSAVSAAVTTADMPEVAAVKSKTTGTGDKGVQAQEQRKLEHQQHQQERQDAAHSHAVVEAARRRPQQQQQPQQPQQWHQKQSDRPRRRQTQDQQQQQQQKQKSQHHRQQLLLRSEGESHYAAGRYEMAKASFRSRYEVLKQDRPRNDVDVLIAELRLADSFAALGRVRDAHWHYFRCLRGLQSSPPLQLSLFSTPSPTPLSTFSRTSPPSYFVTATAVEHNRRGDERSEGHDSVSDGGGKDADVCGDKEENHGGDSRNRPLYYYYYYDDNHDDAARRQDVASRVNLSVGRLYYRSGGYARALKYYDKSLRFRQRQKKRWKKERRCEGKEGETNVDEKEEEKGREQSTTLTTTTTTIRCGDVEESAEAVARAHDALAAAAWEKGEDLMALFHARRMMRLRLEYRGADGHGDNGRAATTTTTTTNGAAEWRRRMARPRDAVAEVVMNTLSVAAGQRNVEERKCADDTDADEVVALAVAGSSHSEMYEFRESVRCFAEAMDVVRSESTVATGDGRVGTIWRGSEGGGDHGDDDDDNDDNNDIGDVAETIDILRRTISIDLDVKKKRKKTEEKNTNGDADEADDGCSGCDDDLDCDYEAARDREDLRVALNRVGRALLEARRTNGKKTESNLGGHGDIDEEGDDDEEEIRARFCLGNALFRRGEYEDAASLYEQCLDDNDEEVRGGAIVGGVRQRRLLRSEKVHESDRVDLLANLATSYQKVGRGRKSQAFFDKALRDLERARRQRSQRRRQQQCGRDDGGPHYDENDNDDKGEGAKVGGGQEQEKGWRSSEHLLLLLFHEKHHSAGGDQGCAGRRRLFVLAHALSLALCGEGRLGEAVALFERLLPLLGGEKEEEGMGVLEQTKCRHAQSMPQSSSSFAATAVAIADQRKAKVRARTSSPPFLPAAISRTLQRQLSIDMNLALVATRKTIASAADDDIDGDDDDEDNEAEEGDDDYDDDNCDNNDVKHGDGNEEKQGAVELRHNEADAAKGKVMSRMHAASSLHYTRNEGRRTGCELTQPGGFGC